MPFGLAPVPTLIWPDSSGRWVTVRADGVTTEQLLDLAGRLTPVAGDWTSDTATTTTTTRA